MAAYTYSAINSSGIELTGNIHAPDRDAAREQLRVRGLLAQDLVELPASGEQSVRTTFKKIKPKSLQIFSRQFATMIDAGLSVVSALVILATLVLIGMLMFLVPVFVKIFEDLGGQLPMLTQWVVNVSDFLRGNYYFVFPSLAALFFGLRKAKRTEKGRQVWDQIKLKVPMKIGAVVLKVTMARFSRTLSTLIAAGVDIIKALEITGQTAGNWVVEEALGDVRNKVQEGMPIAQPLVENPIFPPMVGHMVKIGEETGELEKMLGKIADFYEDEVDASIQTLTSIVEPIMMLGVGIMVGIVIISMYLPMFKLLTLIK